MTRDELRTDTLYFESETNTFFVTPDGIGVYWFNDRNEASQYGDFSGFTIVSTLED